MRRKNVTGLSNRKGIGFEYEQSNKIRHISSRNRTRAPPPRPAFQQSSANSGQPGPGPADWREWVLYCAPVIGVGGGVGAEERVEVEVGA